MGEVRNGVTVANSQVDLLFEAAFFEREDAGKNELGVLRCRGALQRLKLLMSLLTCIVVSDTHAVGSSD